MKPAPILADSSPKAKRQPNKAQIKTTVHSQTINKTPSTARLAKAKVLMAHAVAGGVDAAADVAIVVTEKMAVTTRIVNKTAATRRRVSSTTRQPRSVAMTNHGPLSVRS
jgi:hypothetical protein